MIQRFNTARQRRTVRKPSLSAQVGLAHALVVEQRASSALEHDFAVLKHKRSIGYFQALMNVLLHEQYGDSVAVYHLNDVKHLAYDDWRQAQTRLIKYQQPRPGH